MWGIQGTMVTNLVQSKNLDPVRSLAGGWVGGCYLYPESTCGVVRFLRGGEGLVHGKSSCSPQPAETHGKPIQYKPMFACKKDEMGTSRGKGKGKREGHDTACTSASLKEMHGGGPQPL